MTNGTLYYGDNLNILRQYILNETIDLIYLDPPFNSNRSYNVLFKDEKGKEADSQIRVFDDSWHWGHEAEKIYTELVETGNPIISQMISAMRQFMGASQMMAYLVMMTIRLIELHRVLKPTGSLYLHCDPTASHYLKIVLDTIFGPENFCNHITWQRSDTHNDAKNQFPAISDHILFYRKSNKSKFYSVHIPHAEKTLVDWYQFLEMPDGSTRRMTKEEVETQTIPLGSRRFNAADMTSPNPRPNLMYTYKGYPYPTKGWRYSRETMVELDKKGKLLFPSKPDGRIMLKRYLDEQEGVTIGDMWTDISQLRSSMSERLGYPTQKPLALLERIISASSIPGDVVLDPFCGCGTAITAAQKLGRQWIGIDITHLAIAMNKSRLKDMFDLRSGRDYIVRGEPEDIGAAHQLASEDRYQFQWWALSLVHGRPIGGSSGDKKGKKGADQGIDGIITFIDDSSKKLKRIFVQVKSGQVKSGDIRDLRGVLDREKDAAIGVFITLEHPSSEMVKESVTAGFYRSPFSGKDYPRLQILTIDEIFKGKALLMPPVYSAYKTAQREKTEITPEQAELNLYVE